MDALDIFQTIGSVVALCTGAFTIFDRFFRHQPILSIAAVLEGANAFPMVRIKNTAPFDIYIEAISVEPPAFGVTSGTSVRAMADILMFKDKTALLGPGDDRLFHIALFDLDARGISRDQILSVTVPWRRSESSWIRRKAVVLKTSINDIEERKRAVILAGRRH